VIKDTGEAENSKQNQTREEKQPEPETWTKFAPVSSIQEDESYEAPEIRTSLPLPARPFVKGGFALAFSGSVLILIWIFSQLAGGISWNQEKQASEQQDNQPVASKPSSQMTTEEKLQWCIATRECTEPSKDLSKTATKNTGATPQKKHEVLASQIQPRPQLSYNATQELEKPVQIQQPVQPLVRTYPIASITPVSQPKALPTPVQDPTALLAQASNLGTYTTARDASPTPSPSPSSSAKLSDSNELVADRRLVNINENPALVKPQPYLNLQPGKVIPVTTRIKATVATTTTWMGSSTEQKFRIQTEEDVKSVDGSIAIPKGTFLLAQISESTSKGYVDLQILSVQIDGQEKPIPTKAIIVQGTGGDPIRAKVKNEGGGGSGIGFGQAFLAAGLAGISKAASSANSAKIFVGGNNTTVSGGSNLGAGMAKGVAGSLSQQISGQVSQPNRERTPNQPVLVLKSGTKLELIINQDLAL